MDRYWKIIIGIVAGLILCIVAANYLVYTKSSVVCGKITEKTEIRGASYVIFTFQLNGQTIRGSETASTIVKLPIDSLQKIECIQIEYSEFSSAFSRIVDKRILKK